MLGAGARQRSSPVPRADSDRQGRIVFRMDDSRREVTIFKVGNPKECTAEPLSGDLSD